MKTEYTYMPVNGLPQNDFTKWITRAVKFGVIPNDPEVIAMLTTIAGQLDEDRRSNHLKKLLTIWPAVFPPEKGCKPMSMESDDYKAYKEPENSFGDRVNWTFTRWSKEDPEGLRKLQNETPSIFRALYEDEFGRA